MKSKIYELERRVAKLEADMESLRYADTAPLLPPFLRLTYATVKKFGLIDASGVAQFTKRTRAMESGYLNRLVRLGYLTKHRKGRNIVFACRCI